MSNFECIDCLDTSDLFKEVKDNLELFGELPLRTCSEDSPHRECTDILLRGPAISEDSTLESLWNEVQCINYKTIEKFPLIYNHVLDLMRLENGTQLGRVIITKLPAKGKVQEHIDAGYAGDFYMRYHTVLQGTEGNTFKSGDEEVQMLTGEVWYINNHIPHSVFNDSTTDRIHLICDIKI